MEREADYLKSASDTPERQSRVETLKTFHSITAKCVEVIKLLDSRLGQAIINNDLEAARSSLKLLKELGVAIDYLEKQWDNYQKTLSYDWGFFILWIRGADSIIYFSFSG